MTNIVDKKINILAHVDDSIVTFNERINIENKITIICNTIVKCRLAMHIGYDGKILKTEVISCVLRN